MTATAETTPTPAETAEQDFNPKQYLTRVNGNLYLEVKWRLVWFRRDHPDGKIDTQIERVDDETVIVRATVTTPTGARGSGIGSETRGDFRDYIEKAETKAIGRALATLGYGTQFTDEFSDPVVVDAPVQQRQQSAAPTRPPVDRSQPLLATERQMALVRSLVRDLGWSADAFKDELQERYGIESLTQLLRSDASNFIDALRTQSRSAPAR